MHFDGDAFISYAHLDNVELVEGRKGWVANLHRALEVRVAQLLGKTPQIWRDQKLTGNDLFTESIIERLNRVAILVAVVSPRYVKSEWTIRELTEFWSAAEHQGGIRVRDKARVFKVLKTPVQLDRTPPELRGLLGYEFFKVDPETGKVRELDEIFGPEAHRDFWLRLDDLAHDICTLLESIESGAAPAVLDAAVTPPAAATPLAAGPVTAAAGAGGAVYLAETSSDLRDYREALKRDLLEHGYQVLPDHTLSLVVDEAEAAVRQQLAQCRLSIHLIGRHYGVVPEGGATSLIQVQHELATERGSDPAFSRIIWMPENLEAQDDRQRQLLDHLRLDPRIGRGADLLETYFENLRTAVQEWVKRDRTAPSAAAEPEAAAGGSRGATPRLYLIADERDLGAIDPWAEALFNEGLEVVRPIYEGDEREIREYHEENLASCDAVMIFYGSGNELWVRRKLREIQKAAGYGRTKPQPIVAICLVWPRTAEKERLRTHEATVVPQWDGVALDLLRPLVTDLKAGGEV